MKYLLLFFLLVSFKIQAQTHKYTCGAIMITDSISAPAIADFKIDEHDSTIDLEFTLTEYFKSKYTILQKSTTPNVYLITDGTNDYYLSVTSNRNCVDPDCKNFTKLIIIECTTKVFTYYCDDDD